MRHLFSSLFKTAMLIALLASQPVHASTRNSAPVISGTPITSIAVNTAYGFQPSATDANKDPLQFSIRNKPSWAAFSTATGLLSGTPINKGQYTNIVISVSDGKIRTRLPAFSITVTAASTTTNHPPTISGSPATSATVGVAYTFTPTAADSDGNTLGFSIQNKPSWATFSTLTGKLSGTPMTAGPNPDITISVSDDTASASLAAFAITVIASTPTAGSATLNWTAPTTNTDGSALTNLTGYKIYYGTSASALNTSVNVSLSLSSYMISDLASGTWYFAITAVNSSSVESALSSVVSKTI